MMATQADKAPVTADQPGGRTDWARPVRLKLKAQSLGQTRAECPPYLW